MKRKPGEPTNIIEWMEWKRAWEERCARTIARNSGDESKWQEYGLLAMASFWYWYFPQPNPFFNDNVTV